MVGPPNASAAMSPSEPPRRPTTIIDLTQELGLRLAAMNVPESRRNLSDLPTLAWLLRKLKVGNPGHPDLPRVLELIRLVLDHHTTKAAVESGRLPDRRSGYDRRAPKPGP